MDIRMLQLAYPVNRFRRWRDRVQKRAGRSGTRIRADDIGEALRRLGRMEAPVLVIHSSLSACGYIDGGAGVVVRMIEDWGKPMTLVMPTHSYCYPDGNLPAPCFDPTTTPSSVGAITNYFWTQGGVVRSVHPTHSLACAGPLAREICEGHEWTETPCGRGTPYEKLVQMDCAVLMFGATLDGYTFFHTAEDAASVPYLYEPRVYELAFRDACDIEWILPSFRQDMTVARRFREMDAWMERRGLLRRGKLGLGELLFIPRAGVAHRELVEAMRGDSTLLLNDSVRLPDPDRASSSKQA